MIKEELKEKTDEKLLYKAAELFKAFGDTTRLKILYVLFEGEKCVSEISEAVNMSGSAVSHQLKTLRQASLVNFRKYGKTVYYSLADDHVSTMLGQGMKHVEHINEENNKFLVQK